jgi:hypothetical protein
MRGSKEGSNGPCGRKSIFPSPFPPAEPILRCYSTSLARSTSLHTRRRDSKLAIQPVWLSSPCQETNSCLPPKPKPCKHIILQKPHQTHRAESLIVLPWYNLRQVCPLSSIIRQKRWRMLEKMRHLKVLFEFTVTMTIPVSMRIFMRILPWIRFRHFQGCQNIFIYLSDHSTLNGKKPSDGHKFPMTNT